MTFQIEVRAEDGGSKVLQNVGILLQHYTLSQPRRSRLESSLPWKHQVSFNDFALYIQSNWLEV